MPEIAECRRYVAQLSLEYDKCTLNSVNIVGGRFVKSGIPELNNIKFPLTKARFESKGKFIYWSFRDAEDKPVHFFITLGMAGSFGKKQKHSAIEFNFDKGTVYFNDIRHFGTFKVVFSDEALSKKIKSLGWDPIREPMTPPWLLNKLRRKSLQPLSLVMMDQSYFAGLGNYLRSEILYDCKIPPFAAIVHLTDTQLEQVCASFNRIAHEAYKDGGATLATYSDLYGMAGTYYQKFKVYGQKKDPNGYPVLKAKGPDGRTIHYCPKIQGT